MMLANGTNLSTTAFRVAALLGATAISVAACGTLSGSGYDTGSPTSAPTVTVTTQPLTTAASTSTSTAPTSTAPTSSTTASSAATPSVAEPIAASIDDFLAAWSARNRLLAAQQDGGWQLIEIDPADIIVGEVIGDSRPFGVRTDDGMLLGGGIDASTGEVTSIMLAYRADGTTRGATAAFTTIGATAQTNDPSFDAVVAAYQEVATDPAVETAFVVSGGRGFVIEAFPADDGGGIVNLTVHLTEDEVAARDAVPGLQIVVGELFS